MAVGGRCDELRKKMLASERLGGYGSRYGWRERCTVTDEMSPTFVSYACDILADTEKGLSGPKFLKVTTVYSAQHGVDVPYATYPFPNTVPNKRTALYKNLMAFPAPLRYQIIRELCEHPDLVKKDSKGAESLKMKLIAQYGHLAGDAVASELDAALVERTQHFLGPFPDALHLFEQAIQKHANKLFLRNLLDDLRLALELLLKGLLKRPKSLENQIPELGAFIKTRGGSSELANMFVKLVNYYTSYQNSYVKHDDEVIEEEVEFIFELTASFMKHLVRLSYRQRL
jgi:hypothetical protein